MELAILTVQYVIDHGQLDRDTLKTMRVKAIHLILGHWDLENRFPHDLEPLDMTFKKLGA